MDNYSGISKKNELKGTLKQLRNDFLQKAVELCPNRPL